LDELRRDRLDGVDRHREADADVAAGLALDLRVDADHPALRVEERPARVALVDGRVGLDHVVDRVRVRRLDHALEGADDPGRHRPLEPEWVPDRAYRIADVQVASDGAL